MGASKLGSDLNLVLDGAGSLQLLEELLVLALRLLVVLHRVKGTVHAQEVPLLHQPNDWLPVDAIRCPALVVQISTTLLRALRLQIIHHVAAIPGLHFPWLLVEGVRWVHQGVLHVYRCLRGSEIHRIHLERVTKGRILNCLLLPGQIGFSKWLEGVPVLHLYLIEVGHGDMSPISWLDHHVWRIAVILARIIYSRFV
jgi:hypothetical protein